jgi:protein-S-isoprenylcysteine O-methyltransferase Ste14
MTCDGAVERGEAKNLVLVAVQDRRGPANGGGKAHMLIVISILRIILGVTFFALLLFLPATTLHWWRAWLLLGVAFMGMVAGVVNLARGHEGLLKERLKSPVQKGQPLADKIVVVFYLAAGYSLMAFIPLDVFRFHLMGKPGTLVSSLGFALLIAGGWIAYLALRENAFAALAVKHQEERQHTVIDTGVYSIVRHPMYAGSALLWVAIPLWLESYPAALLASVPIATVALRILFEERFLRRELKGYEAYTKRVRYRLIPFLW